MLVECSRYFVNVRWVAPNGSSLLLILNHMAYPEEAELLGVSDPPRWIDQHFLRQDPFAFAGGAFSFHNAACTLADTLDVERNGIFCIGSGAVGLSINPSKIANGHLKQFDAESDLDIAVVSSRHFELAWRELLLATQPHLKEIPAAMEENLAWQKKRLFDGAILANKLLGSLSFGTQWLGAIDNVSGRIEDSLDRGVTAEFWIYRDYWSLRNYVARGVVACQRALQIEEILK